MSPTVSRLSSCQCVRTAGVQRSYDSNKSIPYDGTTVASFQSQRARLQSFLTASGDKSSDNLSVDNCLATQAGDKDLLNMGPADTDDSALEGLGPTISASSQWSQTETFLGRITASINRFAPGLKPGEDPHAEVFAQDCYPAVILVPSAIRRSMTSGV